MRSRKLGKWVGGILLGVLALWAGALSVDYIRVIEFYEKPLFCLPSNAAWNSGDGAYTGMGYSFWIKGSFLSGEEDSSGVHYAKFSVLGKSLKTIYRGVME